MCESKGPTKPLGAVKVKFMLHFCTCAVQCNEVRSCCTHDTRATDLTGHLIWGNKRITGPSHDVVIGLLVRRVATQSAQSLCVIGAEHEHTC